jgi:3-oxoacyl-[acyl-carrier protein] reductase
MGEQMGERLSGKVALITGAGGGLGGATARRFGEQGAKVIVHDINSEAASARVHEITEAGGEAMAHVAEVADRKSVEEMFDAATAKFGLVDVLVNCAGTSGAADEREPDGGPLGIVDEAWDRLLDIHLNGTFYCTRTMVRRLAEAGRGGSVICLSSIAGLSGYGDIHYSTAKGGLLGFVRAVARRCGPLGIRANAVCPGVIDAGMTDAISRSLIEPMKAMTPLGTYGSADDIAYACLYLASDESGFVTGQWLSPNGGIVIA